MANEVDIDQLAAEAAQAFRRYIQAVLQIELGKANQGEGKQPSPAPAQRVA